jgi:peptide/nickel transport system substrate-binding protein
MDFAKKYKSPALARYLGRVEKVEQEGKYSLKLHLESPWSAVSHVLLGKLFIIPKHIWQEVPNVVKNPTEWPNANPIGSGPFKFESWERGSQLVLSRNEDYFQPVGPDRFVRIVFQSGEMIAAAIERDEIDLQWGESMQPPAIAVRSAKKENVKLIRAPSHGQQVIEFKLAKRPYSDPVFRKALELCLPRKQMIDEVYSGFADFAVSSVPPGNKAWHNPRVFELAGEYNPEKARKLLRDAGYEWDGDGNLCYPPE